MLSSVVVFLDIVFFSIELVRSSLTRIIEWVGRLSTEILAPLSWGPLLSLCVGDGLHLRCFSVSLLPLSPLPLFLRRPVQFLSPPAQSTRLDSILILSKILFCYYFRKSTSISVFPLFLMALFVRLSSLLGRCTIVSKKQTFTLVACMLVVWIFYLYCRSIGDIEFIDMSDHGEPSLDPHDRIGIDTAHLRAKRHRGCWVFVVNENDQFLFVKRTDSAPTCPSTWSLIGEHPALGESYESCAKRALKEEISVLQFQNLMPLEEDPVLLHLDYGRRIDKQWTKLYMATVSKDILRKSDIHENADFAWVNFTEADHWLHQCPDGECRYCNPSKVWKMDSNHTFTFYYSFIEMTVEYLHAAMGMQKNKTASSAIVLPQRMSPPPPEDSPAASLGEIAEIGRKTEANE